MSAATPPQKHSWRNWRIRGQGLVEYAMIMLFMAIVMIVILAFIGQIVFQEMYSKISNGFPPP